MAGSKLAKLQSKEYCLIRTKLEHRKLVRRTQMSVTRLATRQNNPREQEHDAFLRRQAVQLAAQLPEKPADALAVISYMKEVVDAFLAPRPV